LLEVKRSRRRRLQPSYSPSELGDLGSDALIGQHPKAECQRYRADVITTLDRQAECDGG